MYIRDGAGLSFFFFFKTYMKGSMWFYNTKRSADRKCKYRFSKFNC